jgi:hypothetical protein
MPVSEQDGQVIGAVVTRGDIQVSICIADFKGFDGQVLKTMIT